MDTDLARKPDMADLLASESLKGTLMGSGRIALVLRPVGLAVFVVSICFLFAIPAMLTPLASVGIVGIGIA